MPRLKPLLLVLAALALCAAAPAPRDAEATAATFVKNGRPTRLFRIKTVDERVMGALMMHFMLETIIAAHLLGVDPFDQPAVEEGKILARQYLGEMAPRA